jgi:hypothetical protein
MNFILSKDEKINESQNATANLETYSIQKTELDADNFKFNTNRGVNLQENRTNEKSREILISNKPVKCFSDGRTHSFSEIFERRSIQKFHSVKVNANNLIKCMESIKEEKNIAMNNNKIKALYDKIKINSEIEVPDMHYLRKVNKRVKEITN